MRLFFALVPGGALREQIFQAAAPIVARSGGKPVRQQNLHLTLTFLGDVDATDVVREAASRLQCAPFDFALDRFGYFSPARSLWLGPAELPSALMGLQSQLWSLLEEAGYRRERKTVPPPRDTGA